MTRVVGAVMLSAALLISLAGGANAKARGARTTAAPAPASTTVAERSAKVDKPVRPSDDDGATTTSGKTADGKTIKTKTYTFGAMDVEGKLKTPQLLYFLNRVKLELDMSAPDKRSFMKELAKSADDKSL
jgi:hypothetical protein